MTEAQQIKELIKKQVRYVPVAPKCLTCVHFTQPTDGNGGWLDLCIRNEPVASISVKPEGVCIHHKLNEPQKA